MRLLTPKEIDIYVKRHERRRKRFETEGLSPDEAWELADKLWERDKDPVDDRRVCFECQNYNDNHKTCSKIVDQNNRPQTPLRFILQRCEWFKLREK
jgi:hypothetical protein